ncbi:hypothetical protein TRV_00886 [Trichophyton verrucosum HKI 0517]|uniref:Transmembrane protein n=1 Tax=Trichophyton verrucosum (strain HKI 0517) TaxID=663202 RepID=D4D1D6_TRIVH|nr:uncharacterized protein TRV_00886 [Trichophyton verrucosum HKI 0517]EFE44354.1 hypothetical protein TRV_00886 [Trichophyton verrucosum HKI 0517]
MIMIMVVRVDVDGSWDRNGGYDFSILLISSAFFSIPLFLLFYLSHFSSSRPHHQPPSDVILRPTKSLWFWFLPRLFSVSPY